MFFPLSNPTIYDTGEEGLASKMRILSKSDEEGRRGKMSLDVFVREKVVDGDGLHQDERRKDGRVYGGNNGDV